MQDYSANIETKCILQPFYFFNVVLYNAWQLESASIWVCWTESTLIYTLYFIHSLIYLFFSLFTLQKLPAKRQKN